MSTTFRESMGEIFAPMLPQKEELPPVPARDLIYEAFSHLGAAKCQFIDTDDQIIREHVEKAYELLKIVYRRVR